jgi:hypothetical protein
MCQQSQLVLHRHRGAAYGMHWAPQPRVGLHQCCARTMAQLQCTLTFHGNAGPTSSIAQQQQQTLAGPAGCTPCCVAAKRMPVGRCMAAVALWGRPAGLPMRYLGTADHHQARMGSVEARLHCSTRLRTLAFT